MLGGEGREEIHAQEILTGYWGCLAGGRDMLHGFLK